MSGSGSSEYYENDFPLRDGAALQEPQLEKLENRTLNLDVLLIKSEKLLLEITHNKACLFKIQSKKGKQM